MLRYNVNGLNELRHSNEGILASFASVIKRLSDNKLKLEGVHFVHPKPNNITEHQRIFDAPVLFNKKINKLIFRDEYLALPIYLSNQLVYENLKKLANSFQERLYIDGPWSDKVRKVLFNMFKKGHIDITNVARNLATTPRNLQKKLKKERVTYQQILNFVRKNKAKDLLERKNLSINDIALLLGYSDQSSFCRAFKSWYGFTPKQYRFQLGSNTLPYPEHNEISWFENHYNFQLKKKKSGGLDFEQHLFKKKSE